MEWWQALIGLVPIADVIAKIEDWQVLIGLAAIAVNLFMGLLNFRGRDIREDLVAILYSFMKNDQTPTSNDVVDGYIYYKSLVEEYQGKGLKDTRKSIKKYKEEIRTLENREKIFKRKFK